MYYQLQGWSFSTSTFKFLFCQWYSSELPTFAVLWYLKMRNKLEVRKCTHNTDVWCTAVSSKVTDTHNGGNSFKPQIQTTYPEGFVIRQDISHHFSPLLHKIKCISLVTEQYHAVLTLQRLLLGIFVVKVCQDLLANAFRYWSIFPQNNLQTDPQPPISKSSSRTSVPFTIFPSS